MTTHEQLKNDRQRTNRSRIRRVVISVLFVIAATTAGYLWSLRLNETERMLIGDWELIDTTHGLGDRRVIFRFYDDRTFARVSAETGQASQEISGWQATIGEFEYRVTGKDLTSTVFWKRLGRYAQRRTQTVTQDSKKSGVRILELTDSKLVLHNLSGDTIGTFRRVDPDEWDEIIAEEKQKCEVED